MRLDSEAGRAPMSIPGNERKKQLFGAFFTALFGLGVLVVGGRLVAYDHLLSDPVEVSGEIIDSGRTTSSRGGSASYVRYQFADQSGTSHVGTSSGYSGSRGESVLVEHSSRFPFIHRVAGEGSTTGYEWRWYISCFGLFFLVVGVHWGWGIRSMAISPNRQ